VTRHAPARGLLGIACSLIGVGLAVAAIAVLIASFVTENDCDEILMLRAHVERTNNEARADTAHDSRDTPELAKAAAACDRSKVSVMTPGVIGGILGLLAIVFGIVAIALRWPQLRATRRYGLIDRRP